MAETDPYAQVMVMHEVPHLDRQFDYLVPAALDQAARPGVRVRVRLAGRLVDGFILTRTTTSEHATSALRSVHGPPVLTPAIAALCRSVADRYAGTLAEVVRAAVPSRHARSERDFQAAAGSAAMDPAADPVPGGDAVPVDDQVPADESAPVDRPVPVDDPAAGSPVRAAEDPEADPSRSAAPAGVASAPGQSPWGRYRGGEQLFSRIDRGERVRALWLPLPGESWADRIAEIAETTTRRGEGMIVVVPDQSEVERAVRALVGRGLVPERLSSAMGPQARYSAFLRVLSGRSQVVVGTRSAVFAPVHRLAAIVVWDDLDEAMQEPQAPGWHVREVAALRTSSEDLSLLLAGPAVSMEAARMAAGGWLSVVEAGREAVRGHMPHVTVSVDAERGPPDHARMPSAALQAIAEALPQGPVAVLVPRGGYLPLVACARCREAARCQSCGRGLRQAGASEAGPGCPEHGRVANWRCALCGSQATRAAVVGAVRTAEEFGRAFPGAVVVSSSGEHIVRRLEPRDAARHLIVATPGAVPDPGPQGYRAALIVDAFAALGRPGHRVGEQVLRRWFEVAGMVRSAAQGGRVVVIAEHGPREIAALVRWDPLGYAERELSERRELALPPAVRAAVLRGPSAASAELCEAVRERLGNRVLRASGPLPMGDEVLWWVVTSIADGPALADALRTEQSRRSARRAQVVHSRIDPPAMFLDAT